ncbi:MAG: hypothetical protein FWD13_09285 [Treponema sp.]|nr:hypothetical protein [Treponema sp.]
MTEKIKLRIVSKLGLLLVFIGFFMPISCNLNGFQIARTLEAFGGTNLISISLYVIFVGSCIGLFLFLLLIMKIKYSVNYDWLNVLAVIAAFVCFIYLQNESLEGSVFDSYSQLQSGGYLIIIGIIVAFIPLLLEIDERVQTTEKKRSNENHDTGHRSDEHHYTGSRSNIEQSSSFANNEKIILELTVKKPFLTIEYILENTSLDTDAIDNTLDMLIKKGILLKYDLISKHEIIYYLKNIDINNIDKELLDKEFLSMIGKYHLTDVGNIYTYISKKNHRYSDLYIGKLYYLYIHKHGTNEDWNNEAAKHVKLIKKIEGFLPLENVLMYGFGGIPILILLILGLLGFETFTGLIIMLSLFVMSLGGIIGGLVFKKIIKKEENEIYENLKKWNFK